MHPDDIGMVQAAVDAGFAPDLTLADGVERPEVIDFEGDCNPRKPVRANQRTGGWIDTRARG